MTINGITSLDYRIEDKALTVVYTDTTLEVITSLDTSKLEVRTNTGDIVEVLNNYLLENVSYDVSTKRFIANYRISDESINIIDLRAQIETISEVLDALLMGDIDL